MKRFPELLAVFCLFSCLLLAACGDPTATPGVVTTGQVTTSAATTGAATTGSVTTAVQATTSAQTTAAATGSATTSTGTTVAAGSFPRTIVDGAGKSVTIPKKPERIMALSLDVAQITLELVDPTRVVGITANAQDPASSFDVEKAKLVPNTFTAANPDPEKVVALKPDLIFITLNMAGEQDFARLVQNAGIPMVTFKGWDSSEQVKKQIGIIAQAVGEDEKGQALVSDIDKRVAAVKAKTATLEKKQRVLILYPLSGGSTRGAGTLVSELIQAAGGTNVAEELGIGKSGFGPIDVEKIVNTDPDVLVITDLGLATNPKFVDNLLAQPSLASIKAKQNNKIYQIPYKEIASGSHFVDGLEDLAKKLNPQLFN